jgi:hypothetical protein
MLACQLLLYIPDDSVHRDVHFRARAAGEYLDLFFCELLADVDAIGNSDQVGVLELHPRTLVAVVKKLLGLSGVTFFIWNPGLLAPAMRLRRPFSPSRLLKNL